MKDLVRGDGDAVYMVGGRRPIRVSMGRHHTSSPCGMVERLMRWTGQHGAMRGNVSAHGPLDRVDWPLKSQRPNQPRVIDFTYVSTWPEACGLHHRCVCLVHRRLARKQCLDAGVGPICTAALVRRRVDRSHSDRGSQYASIHYGERLAGVDVEPSAGSKGDSDDNALVHTANGLYTTGLIVGSNPPAISPWLRLGQTSADNFSNRPVGLIHAHVPLRHPGDCIRIIRSRRAGNLCTPCLRGGAAGVLH